MQVGGGGGTQAVLQAPNSYDRVSDWITYESSADKGVQEVSRRNPYPYVFFRLESESSADSQDDTESVYSVQGKETDLAQDTSDTESKSDCSSVSVDLEVELVEFDVASLSDDEFPMASGYSSSGTDDWKAAEGALAAVLCDSSLEAWGTDHEMSEDGSSVEKQKKEATTGHWICVQCKSKNDNQPFRYCERCFQICRLCKTGRAYRYFSLCGQCFKVRKSLFPPRPRGKRKRKRSPDPKVNLETVRSCIRRMSEDVNSTSAGEQISQWNFNTIVVPEHLKMPSFADSAISSSSSTTKRKSAQSEDVDDDDDDDVEENEEPASKRRRKNIDSESDLMKCDSGLSSGLSQSSSTSSSSDETKFGTELCIMCNTSPQNGIFLHGSIGHMCCCYKCAMKSWKSSKRCPVCNCKVKNVIKVFKM
ncbi:PREDICTED: E3 ubiquitin-protein ligase Mdm2-like [Nicrophorus vespilloides]|uniref:E3 ubiquitin-protein ligase Mdm2-like n=1 Tax=Nicrophorus vespilloides TaxID=110193 RepID=A0ABM1NGZ4_NICVS|nr:PREDICTED: E3 ubiquitin-protein ligase Mdm2-like [Nicrophorus vespilloides]